jgi:hypothetical protein
MRGFVNESIQITMHQNESIQIMMHQNESIQIMMHQNEQINNVLYCTVLYRTVRYNTVRSEVCHTNGFYFFNCGIPFVYHGKATVPY